MRMLFGYPLESFSGQGLPVWVSHWNCYWSKHLNVDVEMPIPSALEGQILIAIICGRWVFNILASRPGYCWCSELYRKSVATVQFVGSSRGILPFRIKRHSIVASRLSCTPLIEPSFERRLKCSSHRIDLSRSVEIGAKLKVTGGRLKKCHRSFCTYD